MGEGFGATQAHPRVQDPRGKRSTPKPARQLRIFYHKKSPQQIFIFDPKGVIHSSFAHLLLKGVAPELWITPLGLIYKGAKATKGEILQRFAGVLRAQWRHGLAIGLLMFLCTC
jgi:hypothetical protein